MHTMHGKHDELIKNRNPALPYPPPKVIVIVSVGHIDIPANFGIAYNQFEIIFLALKKCLQQTVPLSKFLTFSVKVT